MPTSPSLPAATAEPRRSVPALLILVLLVQFALMPAFLIEGDAVAVRAITARLVHAGAFSIPAEYATLLEDFGENIGQYYFLHPDGDRLYSKYGTLNTLAYIPPVWLHRTLTDIENPYVFSHSMVFILNLYNLLFTVLIAHRLVRIARLHTARRATTWIFVLASLYATFLWYYLRAQGGEIFQVFCFLCLYDHFARALRSPGRDLALALIWLAALALLKSYYVILLPVMAGVWWVARGGQPNRRRVRSLLLALVLPGTVLVLALLGIHAWKFGSPFESGYSQFEPDAFSPLPRGEAILGFLVRPDRSLLLHAPPILLALPGWRKFARERPLEACFAGMVSLLVIGFVSCFANWPGHWCYGPRYLLILAPILTIPMIYVLDRSGIPLRVVLVALLLVSCGLQWGVIGRRFFLAYEVSGMLQQAGVQDAAALTHARNFSTLYRELDRFAGGGELGKVIGQLRRDVPDETAAQVEQQIRSQQVPNFFWFYPIAPETQR